MPVGSACHRDITDIEMRCNFKFEHMFTSNLLGRCQCRMRIMCSRIVVANGPWGIFSIEVKFRSLQPQIKDSGQACIQVIKLTQGHHLYMKSQPSSNRNGGDSIDSNKHPISYSASPHRPKENPTTDFLPGISLIRPGSKP